jgi:DNA-binding transcriptional MerR regulator
VTVPIKRWYLLTSDLAREVGIHPNTVRLYEQWGLLQPVPRSPSGYRRFTEAHLDQLRLIRLAYSCTVIGGKVRTTALEMIRVSAAGDLVGALELAFQFKAVVQVEQAQAEAAVQYLERWAAGASNEKTAQLLRIGDTARLLNTTIDSLRSWERNGLIVVPRNPNSGYREYSAEEVGRLRVIRMLIRSGYGTMAILRMLTRLDSGNTENLRHALDTPDPDEDIQYATNRWLSTLTEAAVAANSSVALLEEMIQKAGPSPLT